MPCLTTPRTSRTRGSLRIESVRALSPGRRRADRADSPSGSCTTTRTGWITPLAPISRSASRPMPEADLAEGKGQQGDGRPPDRDRAPRPMAQPTRPALPTGRRVEPGERAGEPLGAVDVAPQDGEDRREECRGEQDGDADDEQPTHAHRAGVRKRRGDECREPHHYRQS